MQSQIYNNQSGIKIPERCEKGVKKVYFIGVSV